MLDAGLFDPAYYSRSTGIPGTPRNLLLHYLVRGWHQGHLPLQDFDIDAFSQRFPYSPNNQLSPLEVFYLFGRYQGFPWPIRGWAADIEKRLPKVAFDVPGSDAVVVVHAFHLDEFDTIARALVAERCAADVIVTTVHPPEKVRAMADAAGLRLARTFVFPNHGRDVFPWVHLLNHGLLERYSFVAKLHTKRSRHRSDGGDWLRRCLDGLLNPRTLERLRSDQRVGLIAPPGMLGGRDYLEASWARLSALAARSGWSLRREEVRFPMGSMFWARSEALRALPELQLSHEDFEPEAGQLDGTIAHVIERFVGVACTRSGFQLVE